ncbi:enolase C-terminal domain-like protein [Calycina marina]|uniref:Enolase C-terminal domain-like protein n=1 Tax=Calycina marina TaxID=1763456 RepID=A0A9P7Z4Z0_9HELO|nr:enolase C-terminal domain-like protein [Calycina marina]
MAPIQFLESNEEGYVGWGELSLEGHTQEVEGCFDAYTQRVKARKLDVPIYQLPGGTARNAIKVYAWIGGDRPNDCSKGQQAQSFKAVKMNGIEDLGWLDSPSLLQGYVNRLKTVKSLGMDAGIDFHGRVHRPMAKQLVYLLEPHQPMFIEEPLLSENIEGFKAISQQTSTPIDLGERLHSRWEVKPLLEPGAVDIIQPDVYVALAPPRPLGPISLAARVQVDACTANLAIQDMSLGIHYNVGTEDLTSYTKNPEVWNVKNVYLDLSTGPKLGIEIDEEWVRKSSKGAEPWVSPGFAGPGGEVRE